MAGDSRDFISGQILVKSGGFDYIQGPVKKAARLRYNCVSVSSKLVALGSNTGGIYLFSRREEKLVQIAFAEKETNAVVMVQLSPNEKFVGFVTSLGRIHVLELKLETKSKPETLRSTSDLGAATVSCLYWDPTSTRLYVGDDKGQVSLIPVSSNKAKNLFSFPLEVILKLDSAVVQIDKAEDKLLVSTMSRCYLCSTAKQTYSQIGKKLREGRFGACFLSQGTLTPMIYCARPGSRIWEVDFNGNVLNTHQFKQLLAVPPVTVFEPAGEYCGPEEGAYPGQAVSFSNLQVLSNNFLMGWNSSTLYVLDPINVRVILWSQPFSGIQDVICIKNQVFIFLQTMELANIAILPVAEVVPICLESQNLVAAARLCLAHQSLLHHKHVRKKLGIQKLYEIYDKLAEAGLNELAETFHLMVEEVENKTAMDIDSSDSNRSRSSSVLSSHSATDGQAGDSVKLAAEIVKKKDIEDETSNNRTKVAAESRHGDCTSPDENSRDANEFDNFIEENKELDKVVDESEGQLSVSKSETVEEIVGHITTAKSTDDSDQRNKDDSDPWENMVVPLEYDMNTICDNFKEGYSADSCVLNGEEVYIENENISAINKDSPDASQQLSYTHIDNCIENSTTTVETEHVLTNAFLNEDFDGDVPEPVAETLTGVLENNNDTVCEDMKEPEAAERVALLQQADRNAFAMLSVSPANINGGPGVIESPVAGLGPDAPGMAELVGEEGEEIGALQSRSMGSRRHSLTSLSSLSSAEVYMDHQQLSTISSRIDEPIAVPVRKKASRKKRRNVSLGDPDEKKERPGLGDRRKSTGSFPLLGYKRESLLSPTGSLQEPIVEGRLTSSEDFTLHSAEDFHSNTDLQVLKNPDTISLNSVLSNSGEFSQSGNETPRTEFSLSTEFSPSGSGMLESWETGSLEKSGSHVATGSKAKLLKMKDKMQNKTKKLIKNIKEKNLLTKAKELAENFSQVSDNVFSLGEGLYVEPVDTNTIKFDTEDKTIVSTKSVDQYPDESDSITKCLVDIENLQAKTLDTQTKLQDVNTLMNPEAVQGIMIEWVTVLNETFRELHTKMYTQSSVEPSNEAKPQIMSSNGSVGYITDSGEGDKAAGNATEKATNDVNSALQRGDSSSQTENMHDIDKFYGTKILLDKEFCYAKDPLHLSPELFKNVCELAQACFDGDIHGNILMYRNLQGCESRKSSVMVNQFEVTVQSARVDTAEMLAAAESNNCDMQNEISRTDCDTTPIDHNCNDCDGQAKHCNNMAKNSTDGSGDKVVHDDTDDIQTKSTPVYVDLTNKFTDVSGKLTDAPEDMTVDNINEVVTRSVNHSEDLHDSCMNHNSEHTDATVHVDNRNLDSNAVVMLDISDDGGSNDKCTAVVNADREVPKDIEPVTEESIVTANDLEDSDGAMAFFVRCYFPYLTLSRVRDRLLREEDCFNTWCAFVSCLQVLVMNDSERYGVQKGSVIDHLLETQYHGDNGSLLLGHISRLFQIKDQSIAYTCCKCHPLVQPVDVLYLCRMYEADVHTVFPQYMMLMVIQTARTLRSAFEQGLFSHFEVRCVWLELMLSEENCRDTVMDLRGKPRFFAHNHLWQNKVYIDKLLLVSSSLEEKQRLLNICTKYGYWCGVIRLSKQLGYIAELRDTILHLGDIQLIPGKADLGYLPSTIDDWESLLTSFLSLFPHSNPVDPALQATTQEGRPSTLTVTSLSLLLVQYLGPEEALALISRVGLPEQCLGTKFYQSCLLAGMVQKHQNGVIHSMLEKVDSYLWSQRPAALSPQLHYLVVKEKEIPDGKSDSSQQDQIQTLTSRLKETTVTEPFLEDPDCHWGVEAKINLQCPSCNIALKEPVSHEESGVFLFRCGHGYHKLCLPEKECLLCG